MPDTDALPEPASTATESSSVSDASASPSDASESAEPSPTPKDDDEAIVEDVSSEDKKTEDVPPPKTKEVVVDEWVKLNAQAPIWTRSVPSFHVMHQPETRAVIQKMSQMVGNTPFCYLRMLTSAIR